mgnify:CR=1 FL=1
MACNTLIVVSVAISDKKYGLLTRRDTMQKDLIDLEAISKEKDSIKLIFNNLDVRAILSPTVKKGKERLRICLHSFNTQTEIKKLVQSISESFLT